MRKVMVGVPVIYCDECVRDCLATLNQFDHVFIVDNCATAGIKAMIEPYDKVVNPQNVYVNPAWNQIMYRFLHSEFDVLVILNSDMVLRGDVADQIRAKDWDELLVVPLPNMVNDFVYGVGANLSVTDGVPGTMIVLTRKMVEQVYPIPQDILLWFGDNWIYDRLRKRGYTTTIYHGLQGKHGGSRSIVALPEAHEIIEKDKLAWKHVKTNL
jgi:hypothetical protein